MRPPPPSPGQKAYLLALGKDDSDEESDSECDSEAIAGTAGSLLPDELRKRFDSRARGVTAAKDFCFKHQKSCVQREKNRGGNIAVLTCPFRHDTQAKAGGWKKKLDTEREEEEDLEPEEDITADSAERGEPDLVCPFRLVLRCRQAGKQEFWEFDEKECEHEHDKERCPVLHKTPSWVLDQHPVFRAEMAKPKASRRTRPKVVVALSSGEGKTQQITVTTKQLEKAEVRFNKNLQQKKGSSACIL